MSAELAARRTAARAVLGDYTREAGTAETPDLALWAARMADMLGTSSPSSTTATRPPRSSPPEPALPWHAKLWN